jgi:hypothetical protein
MITPEGGYPGIMVGGPYIGITAVTGNSGDWVKRSINLEPYRGMQIGFRWHFFSNSSNNSAGWYIDDVGLNEKFGVIDGICQMAYMPVHPGILCELVGTTRSVLTDVHGYFSFDSVRIGTDYKVRFSRTGYLPDSIMEISVTRYDTTSLFRILAPELYYCDFTETDGGFRANPASGWQWGRPDPSMSPFTAFSDSFCWGTNLSGNYSNSVKWSLDIEIDLGSLERPALKFYSWYQLAGEFAGQLFDGCNVKCSIDGGATFTVVNPDPRYGLAYDGMISSHNDYMGGERGFGSSGYGDYWRLLVFNLMNFAGNTVIVRFDLGSDDMGTSRGWYIDNVQIADNWESVEEPMVYNGTVPKELCFTFAPNPFNSYTQMTYTIPFGTRATDDIRLYDARGRLAGVLPASHNPGTYTTMIDA